MVTLKDQFLQNKNVYTHLIKFEEICLHKHDYIEFFYVYKGQALQILNNKESIIKVGDCFLLSLNDSHTFKKIDDTFSHRDIPIRTEFFKKICGLYSPTLFDSLCNKKTSDPYKISDENMENIEKIAPLLNLDYTNNLYQISEFYIVTRIINIIIDSINNHSNSYPSWLTKLIDDLNDIDNFQKDINSFINNLGYCKEHIRRTFKKYIGMTMTDYFNDCKLKYSYTLLSMTNYTIEEVMEKVGINNTSHFYHMFKEKYNISPNKIRIK